MNINWNNFKFVIKYKQIQEIYVDDYYMDIERLQGTPIWDKYHNLLYWLGRDFYGLFLDCEIVDYQQYQIIKQWFKSLLKKSK